MTTETAIPPIDREAALRLRIGGIAAHLSRMQSNCLEMLVDLTLATDQDRLRWLSEDVEKLTECIERAKGAQLEHMAGELQEFAEPKTIRLTRIGDFYEAYGDDAETLARDMEITLGWIMRDGVRVPMAFIPYHAIDRYVARLGAPGYAVELEGGDGAKRD